MRMRLYRQLGELKRCIHECTYGHRDDLFAHFVGWAPHPASSFGMLGEVPSLRRKLFQFSVGAFVNAPL
jgi:hypothetical protein